jgi:hypothetical protein
MVQGVSIPLKPYHFQRRKGLESPLLSATLMGDIYLLHIINEIVSMVGPLRDLVYTYKSIGRLLSYYERLF